MAGLTVKLWGNTENLKRQRELPSPDSGRFPWPPKLPIVASGEERFSAPEAMHEIVCRAIAALGN